MPSEPRSPARAVATSTWRARLFGTARVMAYAFVASLGCAALGARVVYADFREGTVEAGRELAQLADVMGSTKTVFFNGVQMNVSTAQTDQSPREVLDRFEALCTAHSSVVARAFADIPASLQGTLEKVVRDSHLRQAVIRSDSDDEGALTCFADDRRASLRELTSRVASFVKSHDLAEFGRFRYVHVRRSKTGRTHVMTVWTDASLKLDRMFPAVGDAEGVDSPLVPRPPEARRILSAGASQVPYGLHIYDSTERQKEVRRFYDDEMTARGWKPGGEERENTVVYAEDSGRMLFVTLTPKGAHTLITAIETARADAPPREATVHIEN